MKQLTVSNRSIAVTLDDIDSFEKKENLSLPENIKELILRYSGANVAECIYHNKIDYVFSFIPLNENEFDTSIEVFLPFVRSDELGVGRHDLIPFGVDPGGRPYLVSIGGNDSGVVYFSIVGMGFDEQIRKISNSLEDFINGLKKEDEIE